MPVISFKYSDLCSLIGQDVPMETLADRIPMIGADIEHAEKGCDDMSVEFFPDRPDLYSVEGTARGMRAFLGIETGMKTYEITKSDVDVYIDESVKNVRPYFLCGIVRGVNIDDNMLKSIMEMQEKLHTTIGRKRKKLAIGIHDLDKVHAPFTYRLAEPHSIRFIPLAKTEEMDMEEILTKHEKGRDYAHLLKGYKDYPIILDKDNQVLSFPPIINGSLTTVTTNTHNLFIDVTGFDRKAVKGALDIVASALAERGGKIESVTMHEDGKTFQSPDFTPAEYTFSAAECNKYLGTNLSSEDMTNALAKMGMDSKADGDSVHVTVPPFRLDIMHKVDLFEDVGIGYGFENFGGKYALSQTAGGLEPINSFSENIRDIMVGLGYMEVTTLTLINDKDEFETSKLPWMDNVRVLNPATEDVTCLRSYLMPSLINILRHNKHRDLPQRIFEVGNVVRNNVTEVHLCAMETASKVSFTGIKSVTEAALREMGCEYELKPTDIKTFIEGRGAEIYFKGKAIGMFGEMAIEVVTGYEITHPIAFFELDLGPIIAENKDTMF
ncbi:MAG: phenylalanine--tRNA ligase subunit beta [Candidatus Methanomethylophilaceae archaeon]|nr:phenylalanine--tRNA ligase subunit beta [Candidatus Methanomethylophilaceae archaeon]